MNNFSKSPNGNKYWYNDKGQYHREDGPAVERTDGTKEWWVNGKRHRIGGPAIEVFNGDKDWYIDDRYYRLEGPAAIYTYGNEAWMINQSDFDPFGELININTIENLLDYFIGEA